MIQHYVKQIKKYKKLTLEEEKALAVCIKNGDKKAENKLICANLMYVINVASKYKGQGLSTSELISAGNIGVLEAAKRYNPKLNFKFITYAKHWIKQQILHAIFEFRYPFHASSPCIVDINRYKKAIVKLTKKLKRNPNDLELIDELGIDTTKLDLIKQIDNSLQSVSLYDKSNKDHDYRYIDMIIDEDSNTENELIERSKLELIEKALNILNDREKKVIMLYFGIYDNPLTLKEIGDIFNISIEMVRLIKEKALKKLKKSKYKDKLLEFLS